MIIGVAVALSLAGAAGLNSASADHCDRSGGVEECTPEVAEASTAPAISASGRYVAFESTAPGLVSGDTNAKLDIFVRDAREKTTERISVGAEGAQANGDSYNASMSDDGRFVTFTSVASDLVSGDTNDVADVFVYDRTTGTVERVSVSDGGGQLSLGGRDAVISGDGSFVAFATKSAATPAAESCSGGAEDTNDVDDVYVYDRTLNRTVELVSAYKYLDRTGGGFCDGDQTVTEAGNGPSLNPSISRDGRYVAFESDASNLAGSDTNAARDILVHDRSDDRTGRVSIADTGGQVNGASISPSISDDGRYVAFSSVASDLDQSEDCCSVRDTNAISDIHVRDRTASTTIWASRRPSEATPGKSVSPAISGDGKRVSFASDAALRTSGNNKDTNAFRDIYQTALSATEREPVPLSFDDDQGLGNGTSDRPAESGDGKCTVFSSAASSFLPSFMADSNGVMDVYRHCWKLRATNPFSECFLDRMSEPPYDGSDLPGFYGYDAEGVRPGRVDLCAGDPVNCATGNFFEEQVDFAIGGRGVGLDLVRTYNTQEAASGSGAAGRFGFGWSFSFGERLAIDAASGEVSVRHADGQVARFARKDDGSYAPERLVQSSLRRNSDGSFTYTLPDQRTFAFDAAGRLSAKADRNANETTLAYDGAGRLGSITDPAGRKLTFAYNPDGTVSQATDPAGRTVRYGYDAAKNLIEVTDVGAKSWRFAYDSRHRMTAMTNPRGARTTNVYDARDRVIVQSDPLGRETKWAYDGDETNVTDPAGNVTEERFRSHLPVTITGAQGTSADAVTRLAYDADANLVKVTDPNGRAWSYGYDGQGNRIRATDPLGHSTAHTYDSKRNLTALTLPSGRMTSYGYDARSNLVSIKRTVAETDQTTTTSFASETDQTPTTSFAYDGLGQMVSATDPLGRSWRYAYNDQGDPISATSPAGRKSTATYNAQGWLVSAVSGRGNATGADPAAYRTTFTRDAYGRATAIRDPLGHSTALAYDGAGNLTDETDRDGRHTKSAFDLADQPIEVTRGDASAVKTGYDANGQLVTQTDGLGRTTRYGRDPLGRVSSMTDPLGRKTIYRYDPAGRRQSVTDPAERTTYYSYDDADRLVYLSSSSGTPKAITYGYDVDDQLTSMTDATGRSSFGYDSLGRLAVSTDGRAKTLRYGYDLADRLTSLAYPDGRGTVRRGYDEDGYLTSVADWLGHTTRFGYDADGNLARTERPDGSASSLTNDPNGLVTDLTDVGLGTVLRADTPRTDEGLLASTTEVGSGAAAAESFRYDGVGRLTAAGTAATSGYRYDAADNPTGLASPDGALAQDFDAANQLIKTTKASDGSAVNTFSYDRNGNRESAIAANGTRTGYGYDQADQLTSYSGPDRSRPGQSASAQYAYDGTGLRVAKTVNGSERAQTWDRSGALPVLIADGASAYITGPDGRPIEQILGDGTVRYFHQDAHGSTRALTNQAGSVVASYTYDAYGNRTSPATNVENPFGYDGQYTDPETGLQYLRARYYDPTTAQFLTRDPIVDQTRAPYAYAANSPTNYHDPSGLIDVTPQFVDDGLGYAGDGAEALGGAGLAVLEGGGEFAVGALDTPTLGLTSKGLNALGVHVNTCSLLYRGGGWAPIGGPLSIIGKGAKVARLGVAARGGRGKNRMQFDPRAVGDHTTFRRGPDGRVKHYQDWHREPRNPNGFDKGRRFDGAGKPHSGVPTPHMNERGGGVTGRGDMKPSDVPRGY